MREQTGEQVRVPGAKEKPESMGKGPVDRKREFVDKLQALRAASGGHLAAGAVRSLMESVPHDQRDALMEALREVATEQEIGDVMSGAQTAQEAAPGEEKAGGGEAQGAPATQDRESKSVAAKAGPATPGPAKAGEAVGADGAAKAGGEAKGEGGKGNPGPGAGGDGDAAEDRGEDQAAGGLDAPVQGEQRASEGPAQEQEPAPAGGEQAQEHEGEGGGGEAPAPTGKELVASEYAAHESWARGVGKPFGAERWMLALDGTLKGLGAGVAGGATHFAIGQASGLLTSTVFKKVPIAGPIISLAMNYNAFTPSYWKGTFNDVAKNFQGLDFKDDPWGSTANLLSGVAGTMSAIEQAASVVSALGYTVSGGSFLLSFVFPPAAAVIGPAFTVGRVGSAVYNAAYGIELALGTTATVLRGVKLLAMEGNPKQVLGAAHEYESAMAESAAGLASAYADHKVENYKARREGKPTEGFASSLASSAKEGFQGGSAETKKLNKEVGGHLAEKARSTGKAKQKATKARETAKAGGRKKAAGIAGRQLGAAKGHETQTKNSKLSGEMGKHFREEGAEFTTYSERGLAAGEAVSEHILGQGEEEEGGEGAGHEASRLRPMPEPPGSPAELEKLEGAIGELGGVVEDRHEKAREMGERAQESAGELAQTKKLGEHVQQSRAAGEAVDQAKSTKEQRVQQAAAKTGEAKGKAGEAKGKVEPFATILGPLEKVEWLANHCPHNPLFDVDRARANVTGFKTRIQRARDQLTGQDPAMAGPDAALAKTREDLGKVVPAKARGDQAAATAGGTADKLARDVAAGRDSLNEGKARMTAESADAKAKRKQLESEYRKKLSEMESWAKQHRSMRLNNEL